MKRVSNHRARQTARPAVSLLLLLFACGGGGEGSGGSGGYQDAGPGFCEMAVVVSPVQPEAPGSIALEAFIVRSGPLSGIESFSWEVFYDGTVPATAVPWTLADPDGRRVTFTAQSPGIYRIWLGGSVGDITCFESSSAITAIQSGAREATFRLRITPGSGQPAPVQERLITVYGGADAELGILTIDGGMSVSGQVRSQAGVPLPGYLRVTPSSGQGPMIEAFADADGRFALRLSPGTYDVLVIPTSAELAPLVLRGVTAAELREITVTPGERVEGVVRDAGGAPIADARVSLRAGGVPSTMATTDAEGRFALYARPASPVAITVVPPLATGLPALELGDLGTDPSLPLGGSAMAIAYAASVRTQAVHLRVDRAAGKTPAPGARVTFVARPMAGAGLVTAGKAVRPAAGVLRHSEVADESGMIGPVLLPEAVYDVVIEPPQEGGGGDGIAVRVVDLGASVPAALALAQHAYITGTVVSAGSQEQLPLAGITLHATPLSLLAGSTGSRAQTSSAADGTFALPVAAGDSYDVVWSSRDRGHAQETQQVAAPPAGQSLELGTVALTRAIVVRGRIENQGGAGVAGVSLSLLCYQCTGMDADRPIAQAVTSASGTFVLAVPDPGVDPAIQRTPQPSP